ncbi:MAG: ATP-binding protein [Alphaproteobacteria bacterium]|nr:ATP-binding protein [Alphaproteobacteria bacterium]
MNEFKKIKRKVMPRTLFGRSLLIILAPVLLLQMIVAYIFYDRHWDAMTDRLTYALAAEIDYVLRELEGAKGEADIQRVVERALESLDLKVSLEEGKIEGQEYIPPGPAVWREIGRRLGTALHNKVQRPFVISGHSQQRWFAIRIQLDDNRIARFMCLETRLTSPTTYLFFTCLLVGGTILVGVAIMFMRNQIRPIHRLALAAEKIGKGQDVPFFKLEGATEVRRASRAFLEMKERLKRQIEQRTAMLAGVSHDLRTPLTRMRLQLAMLKSGAEADNFRQDIDEMEKMIEGYLTFAKGDGDEPSEMTDMHTILDRIIGNAQRQGHNVDHDFISARTIIKVRPIAIERAVSNVVMNACKFAKSVKVSTSENDGAFEIIVDDNGPGVPEDMHEDVFRPFFRAEKSRNKKTGGIGLGLSITQDIVHSHGGEVALDKSPMGGLRVVLRLPF